MKILFDIIACSMVVYLIMGLAYTIYWETRYNKYINLIPTKRSKSKLILTVFLNWLYVSYKEGAR